MRIGLDLDGCLVDWEGSICRMHDIDPSTLSGWDSIFTVTGKKPPELFAWCEEVGLFGKADAHEGGVEAVQTLIDAGHDVQFVTARPLWAKPETQAWLAERFPAVPDIHERIQVQPAPFKSNAKCDIYLDDSPIVLRHLRRQRLRVVRFERPWNKRCTAWWRTVKSWPEFVKLIEEYD